MRRRPLIAAMAAGPLRAGLPRPAAPGALLAGAGLLAAPAGALAGPEGYRWGVSRDGRRIGHHHVALSGSGAARRARTEVEITVRLMSFVVFSLRHDYEETWEGTRLVAFRSRSERQGRRSECTIRAEGEALSGEVDGRAFALPRTAAPLSWWDPLVLARPVFDTTTGALVRPPPVRDRTAQGERWRVLGTSQAEAVYAPDGTWIAFSTTGEDGVTARYAPE